MHPHRRQPSRQRLPAGAVIEGNLHSDLGAGIQEPRAHRIGTHDADEMVGRQARTDAGPGRAVIPRPVDVRADVILPVVVVSHVHDATGGRGQINAADLRPARSVPRRNGAPVSTAVARQGHTAIVSPDPDFGIVVRRRRDHVDRAVAALECARRRRVAIAVMSSGRLAVERRADDLPVRAAIQRAKQHLCAGVERIRLLLREGDRREPVVVILIVGRALAVATHDRPWRNVFDDARQRIPARDAPAEAGREHDVRLFRVRKVVVPFFAADRKPLAHGDRAVVAATRDTDRAAVLLTGIDPVRESIVGREVVKLASRLVVPVAPCRPTIHGDRGTLVASRNTAIRLARIDPQEVIVVTARRAADHRPGRATVARLVD